jgi:hypothetical protein
MNLRILYASLLLLLTHTVHAATIRGFVRGADSSGKAEVSLIQLPDSSVLQKTACAADGSFEFNISNTGTYFLKVECPEYPIAFSKSFAFNGSDETVEDIFLKKAQKALNEVTVRGQKPIIEVKPDKIVMNVDASIVSTGSTAMDVLQRAPGVSVDQNDNISLKGKQGVQVMIDGKLQPLGPTELAALLRAMPSGSIDKVEIIANPGAKYDAAGSGGILNIKTKKDRRMGVNGSATAGYGQGILPKANAGLSLNKRDKKLLLCGTYNYAYRENINNLDLYRQFFENGQPGLIYDQRNDMTLEAKNHYFNAGADYDINRQTTIGAMLSGGKSGFSLDGLSKVNVLDPATQPYSYYQTKRDNVHDWGNWAANASLRHNWDSSKSEISVDLDAAKYTNTSDQQLFTQYQWADGSAQRPDYLLTGNMDGYTNILSVKADYATSFTSKLRFEAGAKVSDVRADNNPVFYDCSSGSAVYDTGKSNHFIYDEQIRAAYVNLAQDGAKWGLQVGLRAEQTVAKGHQLVNDDQFDRNYLQLFPNIVLTRHVNDQNDLSLSLNRRIDRPNYQQLNPFKRYLDVNIVNQGNPYLNPALTWTVELSHTWKGKFLTQLSWSRTNNVITQVIQPVADNSTIVTDQNLATNTVYNLSGTYPLQIKKWWSLAATVNLYYTYYEGYLAATTLSSGSPVLFAQAQNNFTISPSWTAELTGWYQTEQQYGYMMIQPQYVVNVGVQKTFWDRKANIRFNVTDIFLHQNPSGTSSFSNYHEDFIVHRDSRVATISATYRFGQNKQPLRRHSRGAEDELRRANGGNG